MKAAIQVLKGLLLVGVLGLFSSASWGQMSCMPGGQLQGNGWCAYPDGSYMPHQLGAQVVLPGPQNRGSSSVPQKPRVLASKYGAVALDMKTGGFDSSYDEVSEAVAKSKALQKCASKDCKIIGYYRNTCTALARGQISKTRGVTPIQYGITKAIAETKAIARCEAIGAKDCKIMMPAECSLPS